jgi:hypothetical protein
MGTKTFEGDRRSIVNGFAESILSLELFKRMFPTKLAEAEAEVARVTALRDAVIKKYETADANIARYREEIILWTTKVEGVSREVAERKIDKKMAKLKKLRAAVAALEREVKEEGLTA